MVNKSFFAGKCERPMRKAEAAAFRTMPGDSYGSIRR